MAIIYNKKGFVVVSQLILTPFLILSLLLIKNFIATTNTHTQSLKYCRDTLSKYQNTQARHVNSLLSLNKFASLLRQARVAAEVALAAAIASAMTPAIAAARTALTAIKIKQKLLSFRQKSLLILINKNYIISLYRIRYKMSSLFKNKITLKNLILNKVKFRNTPKSSPTPDYHIIQPIKNNLISSIDWAVPLKKTFLPFLKLKNSLKTKLKNSCAVYLVQNNKKWIERLEYRNF